MLAGAAKIQSQHLAAIAERERILGVVRQPSQRGMMALKSSHRIVWETVVGMARLFAVGNVLRGLKHYRAIEFELAWKHFACPLAQMNCGCGEIGAVEMNAK